MRRWINRILPGLAGFAALFAVAPAFAQSETSQTSSAWEAHPDDSLLFDIRLGQYRLGDGVRGYQTPGSVCVIFDDVIEGLDVPITIDEEANRATGWAFREENQIDIDLNAGRLRVGDIAERLPQDVIFDTPEGWCVSSQALAVWLGVDIDVDMRNAVLAITSEDPLPVERALQRREQANRIRPRLDFDLSSLPQADMPYRMWRTPSVDAVVRLGGLRDRQNGSQSFERRYELFASGEVLTASVDARLASDNRGVPNSLRMRAFRSSNDANLLGPLRARHFAMASFSHFRKIAAMAGMNLSMWSFAMASTALKLCFTARKAKFVVTRKS